jgi:hypothetical protein
MHACPLHFSTHPDIVKYGFLPFSSKQQSSFPVPKDQVFEEEKLLAFLTSTTNEYRIERHTQIYS